MVRPRRLRLATSLLLLSLPLSGALRVDPVSAQRNDPRDSTAAVPIGAQDLTGAWEGVVRLDSTWGLPQRPSARSITARVRFHPVGDASPTTMSSRSVHAGTFEIDFDRFGFTLATPDALGWSIGTDSMHAVLNPAVNHGTVELRGTFRGDTITGTWRYVSDPGGARGTFLLRRVTSSKNDEGIETASTGEGPDRWPTELFQNGSVMRCEVSAHRLSTVHLITDTCGLTPHHSP
jgi:hypothetical protein